MKVPAEALRGSLAPGREGLSGLPHHPKPARSRFAEGWSIYPPYPIGVPVRALRKQGLSHYAIADTLGISRPTVRRFLAAEQFPDRLALFR